MAPMARNAAGGGLYVAVGTVTLNNDTFQGNQAQGGNGGDGGYAGEGALSGNGGSASGGAVDVAGGVVTLSNDIFQGNHALGGSGGHGYYSTLGGTAAAGSGGAVNVTGGTVTLSNDTLNGNEAAGGTGGNGGRGNFSVKGPNGFNGAVGEGGAVGVAGGTVTLSNDTISSNEALGGNGGTGGTGYSFKPIGGAGPGSDGGIGGTAAGGGIYVAAGTVTVSNGTTLGSNQAVGGRGGQGGHGGEGGTTDYAFVYGAGGTGGTGGTADGGGLYVASGDVVLGDSSNTISRNTVTAGAGGDAGIAGYGNPYLIGSPGSAGTGSFPDLAANSPGFGAFLNISFPTILTVSPNVGPDSGGTTITITGTNFHAGATVSVGGVAATGVTVNSSTSITATTPAGTEGAADVVVTNTDKGTSAISSPDRFTYFAAPTVSNASANFDSIAGGTSIVITGTNLTGTTQVDFGSVPAASFTVDSRTQITAIDPEQVPGIVDVTVTTPGGTSARSDGAQFTYVAPGTVGSPPVTPPTGPTVTISPPSATSTTSGPITYTITYSDSNFNGSTLLVSNVMLNKTGTAFGTVSVSPGSGATRIVTISNITGVGTLGISLAAGTADDLAGK